MQHETKGRFDQNLRIGKFGPIQVNWRNSFYIAHLSRATDIVITPGKLQNVFKYRLVKFCKTVP